MKIFILIFQSLKVALTKWKRRHQAEEHRECNPLIISFSPPSFSATVFYSEQPHWVDGQEEAKW